MRAWPGPDVPRLPGRGPLPSVYDTASGETRTVGGGAARLYVCGITPYDATHLGHAATYLAFDLLGRVWRDAGALVTYAQNITDVDDPLLARATATEIDWQELASGGIELFRTDMAALRVLPPEHYIGVAESIPLVAAAVSDLVRRQATYEIGRDLYFAVRSDSGFGRVSHLTPAAMRALCAERGGDPDLPGKKDPLDCLLWRSERAGEPAWDSQLGVRGRPGWHIECTAIAREFLGEGFDVQGGGSDLIFPHHEMSAAQAEVLGARFARTYVHAGMVGLDGEKMSKSKGNLVLVSRLREAGVDPMVIRLALLGHHYRTDWSWTAHDLEKATTRLGRWRSALTRTAVSSTDITEARAVLDAVRAALSADLDAPTALTEVDQWADRAIARAAGTPAQEAAPGQELVRATVDALLGVVL